MSKKTRPLSAAAILLSLTLAACGGNSSAPEPSGTPSAAAPDSGEKPVEISFAWWGGEARHELFNKVLDEYEASHPGVTFLRQYSPWGDYWTKLTTQSASGSMPDSFGMTAMYKTEFNARGVMESFEPYIADGRLNVSDFTAGALNAGRIDGELKYLTFGDTVSVLAFNKTLVEQAGMPLPKGEMSESEYVAYCTELAGKLPPDVYASTYFFEHQWENHCRQFGMTLVSEDGREPGYSRETLTDYYKYLKALLDNQAGPPAQIAAENIGKQWVDSLEGTGRIALFQTNLNQLKIYQAQTDDELSAVRGLIADGATHRYVEQVQPSGWCVHPGSKQEIKDAAVAFLSDFVNNEKTQMEWNMELGVPGSAKMQEVMLGKLGDSLVDNSIKVEIKLVQEILGNVEPHPGRRVGAVALIGDVDAKWQEIMFDRMTIEEAVNAHFDNAATMLG